MWRHLLPTVVAYVGVVVWLTWPLAAHLGDRLPNANPGSSMDGLHSAWVLAYQTHALATDPRTIADANIFYPTPRALFYGQTATGAVPYFALPFLATGNAASALNLTFLGGVLLTLIALHVVVVHWTASHAAALLAATTFLLTPWVLWAFTPSAPQYTLIHYLPVIVLLAARPRLSARATAALVLLVSLQALVDVVYLAIAVLVPLGLLGLGAVAAGGERRAHGCRLLAAVVVAALCILPIHAGHWAVRADNPALDTQTTWALGQAPLQSILDVRRPLSPTAVPLLALALIGLGGLVRVFVSGAAPTLRAAWRHAGFFAVAGFVMSLKPPGRTDATSSVLRGLLAFDVLRVPLRLGVAGLIGLCLLVGLGFVEVERGLVRVLGARRGALAAGMLAFLTASGMYLGYRQGGGYPLPQPLPGAYPLQVALPPEPAVLTALRSRTGPLLELPAPQGVSGTHDHALAMFRSTYHWHPLLNGYDGYWPAGFPARMELARRLPDVAAFERLYADTGVQLVLVRTAELPGGERARWRAVADAGGFGRVRLVARGDGELLFGVGDEPVAAAP